jgi:predicted short-subunit dehydrogenase-like oxidoreductase (DUF2520 family)
MNTQSSASPKSQTFAIVGAGRVGISLGRVMQQAGYRIIACSVRSKESQQRAAQWLNVPVHLNAADAARQADCVIVSVPDAAIPSVCEGLVSDGALKEGSYLLHTAGALGTGPLEPAQQVGAKTAAFHPLQSIPDVESGIERVSGSWIGLTCAEEVIPWAEELAADIGCRVLVVPEDLRTLYHASAVIASNYLVTLAGLVHAAYGEVEPFLPLMRGTLANVEALGPATALTGPIVRGEAETVESHIEELQNLAPTVAPYYRILGVATAEQAAASGRLHGESALRVVEALRKS